MFIKEILKLKLFGLCLTAALATCLFATGAQCGVISVGEIRDCIQTDADLKCAKKKVVGVVVSPGLTATVEALKVIEYDQDGEPTVLDEPLKLVITKTPVRVQYPYGKEFSIEINVKRTGYDDIAFSISPDDPVYNTGYDHGDAYLRLRAVLAGDFPAYEGEDLVSRAFTSRVLFTPGEKEIPSITNSLVVLFIEGDIIRGITPFSFASLVLDAIQVEPFQEGARSCDLNVKVQNIGDIDATNYIVTVTDMTSNFDMVPAQAVTLNSQETRNLTFRLHSDVPLTAGGNSYECHVTVKSANGYIFDTTAVIF